MPKLDAAAIDQLLPVTTALSALPVHLRLLKVHQLPIGQFIVPRQGGFARTAVASIAAHTHQKCCTGQRLALEVIYTSNYRKS